MSRTSLLLLTICFGLLLSSCWNRRELNELAIAVAVGLDDAGNQVRATVQAVIPAHVAAADGKGSGTPVITYSETADTVFEAFRKMTTMAPRKIYLAHIRVLLIGEELAREGIANDLELFYRDQELRSDFYVVVIKDNKAEDALKVLTGLVKIPANKLFNSLEASEKAWAPTKAVTLAELIRTMATPGQHALLTGLMVTGSLEEGETKDNMEKVDVPVRLKYGGLAVFRGDKLIGWFNEDESKGINFILDNVKSTVGYNECEGGGKIVYEVIRSKSEIKGKVKGNRPSAEVRIQLHNNVAAVQCKIDLMDPETLKEQEKLSEAKITSIAVKAIRKAQEKFHADVFGFGEAVHRADSVAWARMKNDWDDVFPNMQIKVDVDVKTDYIGTKSDSYINKLKEQSE